jgi:hypothetical protein
VISTYLLAAATAGSSGHVQEGQHGLARTSYWVGYVRTKDVDKMAERRSARGRV